MDRIQLLIQTVLRESCLALFVNGNCIKSIATVLDHRSDNTYVDDLNHMLKEMQVPISSLKEIYLVNGPGFFTGIRSGVIIAKALYQMIASRFFLVSSFDYLVECIPVPPPAYGIAIKGTKREGYFRDSTKGIRSFGQMLYYPDLHEITARLPVFTDSKELAQEYPVRWIEQTAVLPSVSCEIDSIENIYPDYIRTEEDLFKSW